MCCKWLRINYRLSGVKEVKVIHGRTFSEDIYTEEGRIPVTFRVKTGLEIRFETFTLVIATEDAEEFAPILQSACTNLVTPDIFG